MPANPTLADFARAFLARFVKPSDSAAARIEITTLKQTGSDQAFAAHFGNVNSRIIVDSPIDTTTLATCCQWPQRQGGQSIGYRH